MLYLKQSTAGQEVMLGPFVDDSDGKTAETGLTIANTDIKIWKEGATTEASKNSGGATHIASGRYYAVLDATDTDTIGKLEINVAVSGALPVLRQFHVLHANVYDWMFGSAAPNTMTPLDAAGVRGAVGLASANLDTQLADLPTNAEFEARTLPTADYFDPSTDTVVVGTNNDKTGYSISGTKTTLDNLNDISAAAVNAEVDTALADYDGPTNAEMVARTLAAADYATATALSTVDSVVDATKSVTDKLDTALELDGAVYRYTTNALEQAPSGGGGVADWTTDERDAIRSILGIPSAGTTPDDPTVGILDTIRDAVGAVQSDTNDIQGRLPAALVNGRMDSDLGGIVGTALYVHSNIATTFETFFLNNGLPSPAMAQHAYSAVLGIGEIKGAGFGLDDSLKSISDSLPANFATLGINASGHIERVTLVDTTTANTDMRGTDSAYTGTPPTVDEIATRLLATPANKLATNSDGSVNATVSGVDVDEEALADALIEAGVASQASVDAVKAKTDLLGTAGVTFHAPVASDATVSVRRSRDYHNSDGRALEWTNADGTWPDLTDATFKVLLAEPGKVTAKYVFSGTVVTPAGAGQKVRLELTDTQLAINADDYVYEGKATLASGNVIDLHGVSGPFSVLLGMDEPA